MDLTKIKDIISVLPLLVIYILPGYIFISIKDFITNKDLNKDESKNVILKSIGISYILINIESVIYINLFGKKIDISDPHIIISTAFISFIVSYIYSRFVLSELCDKTLKILKINRTFKTDALSDIVDFKLGMWIRVFLTADQVIYQGKIRRFERITDSNYFIVLSNFSLTGYSGEEFENKEGSDTSWVAINLKDNYRIELYYSPDSKKIIG